VYDTPIKATCQHHTTVDHQFHMELSQQRLRVLQQWVHQHSPAIGLHDFRA